MSGRKPIIAIDGPVGVGKSSVAASLAERLGLVYIDSGAMYRAVTLKVLREGIDSAEVDVVSALAERTDIRFVRSGGALRIELDGEDVSSDIRAPEVSRAIAPIADNPRVRERLVSLQQAMGESGGVVMEGRDIGTVVFPDAELKIYLDADPRVRAERRHRQLVEKGKSSDLETAYADLLERDRRDRSRPVGALRKADDAVEVDCTHMGFDETVEALYHIASERIESPPPLR